MEIRELIEEEEQKVQEQFKKADKICEFNSRKVLDAFRQNNVQETDFGTTTGYGYADIGREKIEKVFSQVLHAEDCKVSVYIWHTCFNSCIICIFKTRRHNA